MISIALFFTCLMSAIASQNITQPDSLLAYCNFSKLPPGKFGEQTGKGFPEYHYIPRKFTDGWEIVNNRGPDEWKIINQDEKNSLYYLGYNETAWTHDFTYPIICYGDSLWKDYTLEVTMTPLSRSDLNGIIFRYRDGRHYYMFGLGKTDTVTLRYRDGEKGFRQDGWHELASSRFPTNTTGKYILKAVVRGQAIKCYINGKEIFSVKDDRYKSGKTGLFATSPVAFHEVKVVTSPEARQQYLNTKEEREKETAALRLENPRPLLWKRIKTKGFGAARAMRLGDLDGDGTIDFLLIQNVPFFESNYNQISCLTALDSNGTLLWQSGSPDPDNAWVSYDVAVQIHDIDGDGHNEVIYAQGQWIKILDGKTGKEKNRFPVPASTITPEEKSWLEYKHYYRRDNLPWLNVDCIAFADLTGNGEARDIIIKDRYTRLWAYNNHFDLLWTASANLGHFPAFYDSDGGGRDEVYIGYSKFDPDGKLIWTLDGQTGEHADGVCIGDFSLTGKPETVFIGGSDDGVLLLDGSGHILKHHMVGHAQTPSAGQFRPDIPGLEFCDINYWGEPGLITIYSCTGEKLTDFEIIHSGSPVEPVNWRGDGTEFIFLSADTAGGGLIDGWGRRAVLLPKDDHPQLAWMARNITGDPRDELIVWNTDEIYIYTQDRPFAGSKIYSPVRQPLYNESNYAPVVSWPAWK